MNRVRIAQRLVLAEKHIERGNDRLVRHVAAVKMREAKGLDTGQLKEMLAIFKELLISYKEERDKLLRHLDKDI